MPSIPTSEEPHSKGGLSAPCGRPLFVLVLGLALGTLNFARGQIDTTDAPRRPPADSLQAAPSDTSDRQSLRPFPFSPPLYGRPHTDSIPGRRPHVSIESMLAEQPGSFSYDLGAVGWPHGWSRRGLAPHRIHLWFDGRSLDDPLTGRPRFELLPPSFLERPRTGIDPGGGAVGVHTFWREYAPKRPVTELRYRRDSNGLHAIEAAHSQKRRLDLFGRPGVLQLTFGYGGRKANGVYEGSALSSERRVWGRLRYQTNDWVVELTDQSSRYRIGAHGGVQPPGQRFESIYALPLAATSVENAGARRQTIRNDLTARFRGPLLPDLDRPTEMAATWTSNTFDFRTGGTQDSTWTVTLNGGQARVRQSLGVGSHTLTLSARGAVWQVARGNVPQIDGVQGSAHVLVRDSLHLGPTRLAVDAGGHLTSEQQYPSFSARVRHPVGPVRLSAALTATGQRTAWVEENGFGPFVQVSPASRFDDPGRLIEGTAAARTQVGPVDAHLRGFAHRIGRAADLYAAVPEGQSSLISLTDSVVARHTETPVLRAGATLSLGWRRDATRGLYATGQATLLQPLNAGTSTLHTRLSRTLPPVYGQARLGARMVLFTDLVTDLYVQARGWGATNSRWFHPPTGRLVVPPRQNPVPAAPGYTVGPSGTIDVRAETQLRDATLFFTFENVQARTELQPGTFIVPVYPLPARQFRFGVFWPIFD